MSKFEFNNSAEAKVYHIPSLDSYIVTHQKLPDCKQTNSIHLDARDFGNSRNEDQWPLIVQASKLSEDTKAAFKAAINIEQTVPSSLELSFNPVQRDVPHIVITDSETNKSTPYYIGAFGTDKIRFIEQSPAFAKPS